MKNRKNLLEFLEKKENSKEDIFLDQALYYELRHFRLPFIITVLTMLIGSLGYILIDNFSLIDAIYQTGITFTTVGFGEIAPISPLGRIFTITLIIVGFAVFTLAVGIVVNVATNGDIIHIFKVRRMLYRIARLKNHFVLYYLNDYTIEIASNLRKNHIPFVVIDPSEGFEERARQLKFPYFLQAEPHTEIAMKRANLGLAKGVITLSEKESDNIALIVSIRLFEKEYRPHQPFQIITSAKSRLSADKLRKLGADSVVLPTALTAQRISTVAVRPDFENLLESFLYSNDTAIDIEEVFVPKYSWVVLQRLKDIKLRTLLNVSIVGIRMKEGSFIPMPKGDTLITAESNLLVIGKIVDLKNVKNIINRTEKPK
ncbi:MAG TPA: potassium channel protein [Campylobacterales bacterium]|nr:potassium channel protein [Campylobacterales bacterium]HIO71455.1 potassium channel protein [Campylobacterales bacterium]